MKEVSEITGTLEPRPLGWARGRQTKNPLLTTSVIMPNEFGSTRLNRVGKGKW